ncbi:MAG TPA: hypothetical protein VF043_39330 [Ktedonobacteraceae bacterium]
MHTIVYRLWQVRQQLGFVAPLTAEERMEAGRWLPPSALPLFQTMSDADQRHSLRVCRGLQQRGCMDEDMLAAALLHDVGKAGGRVPFWTRPVIVLGKMFVPRLLAKVVVDPRSYGPLSSLRSTVLGWRRALGYAWWHAEIGAELAVEAGLSERAALYIRTHHQPDGPAAELHIVDEAS